jgi:hypothetical protein
VAQTRRNGFAIHWPPDASELYGEKGMKSILVLMMATLLATATAVSAQTPPRSSSPQYFPPTQSYAYPPSKELESAQAQVDGDQTTECPFAKALQEANVAWQRLRALCGAAKMGGCADGACAQTNSCKGNGCAAGVTGVAGCAKGAQEVQAPKSCCCAKGCACCETCKTAKVQLNVQYGQCPVPMACPVPTLPAPTASWRMQAGPATVQIVAQTMPAPVCGMVQAMPAPACGMVPNFAYMSTTIAARPAKLVTPDFEAHCDQMIHRGDTIQLVGNVMLLCKKHAQPIRVEGQRIVINLNDGSFVVETGPVLPRPSTPAAVGVMRMSIGESSTIIRPASVYTQPCVPTYECPRSVCPTTGIIEVVPVPPVPVTSPRPR